MPVTPVFSLSQDDTYVYITIKVPHIRVSSAEVHADGRDFSFYCKPYLLNLTLPYEVNGDEDERQIAVYNPELDNGTLVAHLPKSIEGQHFPNLDLTTCILNKINSNSIGDKKENITPFIEVISSTTNDNNDNNDNNYNNINNNNNNDKKDNNDINNTSSSSSKTDPLLLNLCHVRYYGFNNSYCNVLTNLREECMDVIEISDPDKVPMHERRQCRLMTENSLFDPARYLGDLFEAENDPIFISAMDWQPFWEKQGGKINDNDDNDDDNNNDDNNNDDDNNDDEYATIFTQSEKQALSTSLRNKEYLVAPGSDEEASLLMGLVDIVFSFCYEARITLSDLSVVSSFNISRLSSTLSWFDSYDERRRGPYKDTLLSVILSCMRRSIIYPYLRLWEYGMKVLGDTSNVFRNGKRCILKCLLKTRHLFEHKGDSHYLLNKLYINDYCVWIQTVADEAIELLSKRLMTVTAQVQSEGKGLVGFRLPQLEAWAHDQLLNGQDGGSSIIPDHLLEYEEPHQEGDEGEVEKQLEKLVLV